jgi:hypothetical protein
MSILPGHIHPWHLLDSLGRCLSSIWT